MATYTTLKYGSSGGDVKKLQEGLINKGYDLGKSGADGVYGSSTKAAVTKYQQDMGLGVDGIAGNETLGKLYSAPSTDSTTQTDTAPKAPQTSQDWATHYEGQLGEYKPPEAAKPNDYSSPYAADIEAALDSWKNRKDFSYDFNTDPMYQQYRDQYMLVGQQAMRDTMGQAAALTGGYGNSYAQMVGQQAYDNYLSRLNEIIPTLRGQAYDMYNAEGDRLAQALSTYLALDDTAYGRHRDEVGDELARQQEEYQRYMDELAYMQGERDYWNDKAMQEAALAAAVAGGRGGGGNGDDNTAGDGNGFMVYSDMVDKVNKMIDKYGLAYAKVEFGKWVRDGLVSNADKTKMGAYFNRVNGGMGGIGGNSGNPSPYKNLEELR